MVHLIVAITGAPGAPDSHRCSGAADPGADCGSDQCFLYVVLLSSF